MTGAGWGPARPFAIAGGSEAVSDFRVIGDQGWLFGPVHLDARVWRTLAEIAPAGRTADAIVKTTEKFRVGSRGFIDQEYRRG